MPFSEVGLGRMRYNQTGILEVKKNRFSLETLAYRKHFPKLNKASKGEKHYDENAEMLELSTDALILR